MLQMIQMLLVNLTNYSGQKIVKEIVSPGKQKYSYSPTINNAMGDLANFLLKSKTIILLISIIIYIYIF